jgi:hypothetical protein
MTNPENTPKITNVLFTDPKNETKAMAVMLKFQFLLLGSDIVNKEIADQKIVKAKIGWYCG